MIGFELASCPPFCTANAKVAWDFLSLLLRTHIQKESFTSHVGPDLKRNLLLGRIRENKGEDLITLAQLENSHFFYPAVITWVIKASGYLPDSTSISQYAQMINFDFYAKTDTVLVEFSCLANMPKTRSPQASFRIKTTSPL
jgi:hypothetical protein